MVSADTRIREGGLRRLVRLGRGKLRLGRPKRMEAGPSGKSGPVIFDATCAWRSKRGRFAESAYPRSRSNRRNAELRPGIGRTKRLERPAKARTRTEGNFKTEVCGAG